MARGRLPNRNADNNETTKVACRFTSDDWVCEDDFCTINTTIPVLNRDICLRVRGTNTTEVDPEMDVEGDNPWAVLWFYSNPIFINVRWYRRLNRLPPVLRRGGTNAQIPASDPRMNAFGHNWLWETNHAE